MSTYVDLLLDRYRSKGVLIDSNLLLLHLVGTVEPKWIGDGRYNKLSKYTFKDFAILRRLLACFSVAVTTPHVLTELSNLCNDLPMDVRERVLARLSEVLMTSAEMEAESLNTANHVEFRFLGLTDTRLLELSNDYLVVSDDVRMVTRFAKSGWGALNFNFLRTYLFPR